MASSTRLRRDTVVERDGVKVFVDMKSHELLAGATIDFVVASRGGFTFEIRMQHQPAPAQVVRLTSHLLTRLFETVKKHRKNHAG